MAMASEPAFRELYDLREKLAEGGQAAVHRAVDLRRDQPVAIKVYRKGTENGPSELQDLELEINLLKQLRHAHIVRLVDVQEDSGHVYLVQELLEGEDLFEFLKANGALQEPRALDVFAQLCLAVDYLHGLGVAHRDIKSENVVFVRRGTMDVKLVDFGTADSCSATEPLTGLVGTPQYMAPEILRGWYTSEDGRGAATSEPYGLQCDVWSLGVVLYEMLSFQMPFRHTEMGPLLAAVAVGAFDRSPILSKDACELIDCMLDVNPSSRMSVASIKQHRWAAAAVAAREGMITRSPAPTEPLPKRPTLPTPVSPTPGRSSGIRRGDALALKQLARRAKASRGHCYWSGGDVISQPAGLTKRGSVQRRPDGQFVTSGEMPPQMAAMLREIEIEQAERQGGSSSRRARSSDCMMDHAAQDEQIRTLKVRLQQLEEQLLAARARASGLEGELSQARAAERASAARAEAAERAIAAGTCGTGAAGMTPFRSSQPPQLPEPLLPSATRLAPFAPVPAPPAAAVDLLADLFSGAPAAPVVPTGAPVPVAAPQPWEFLESPPGITQAPPPMILPACSGPGAGDPFAQAFPGSPQAQPPPFSPCPPAPQVGTSTTVTGWVTFN